MKEYILDENINWDQIIYLEESLNFDEILDSIKFRFGWNFRFGWKYRLMYNTLVSDKKFVIW